MATEPGQVLAIMTADCIPVLFCHHSAPRVAAAHAGWRGLATGVLERTVESLASDPGDLMAWLGPGIGPDAFEVGPEVRRIFLDQDPGADVAFRAGSGDRWLGDLFALARRRLRRLGVEAIHGGQYCTYSDPQRFFSYRRDGKRSGRMGTFIWLKA